MWSEEGRRCWSSCRCKDGRRGGATICWRCWTVWSAGGRTGWCGRAEAEQRPEVRLLMTHPGVGPVVGLAFVLTIGPHTRFPRGKKVASYLGLIPGEHSSGGRQRLGPISKQGNTMMRTLLVEAAQTAARLDEELRRAYGRLKAKTHSAPAKVMVARKLAVRMYWMLRENKTYAELYAPHPVARTQGSSGHSVVEDKGRSLE